MNGGDGVVNGEDGETLGMVAETELSTDPGQKTTVDGVGNGGGELVSGEGEVRDMEVELGSGFSRFSGSFEGADGMGVAVRLACMVVGGCGSGEGAERC